MINAIEKQVKIGSGSILASEWNKIINILSIQTNNNTYGIERLFTLLDELQKKFVDSEFIRNMIEEIKGIVLSEFEIGVATPFEDGLMSKEDKQKLIELYNRPESSSGIKIFDSIEDAEAEDLEDGTGAFIVSKQIIV